MHQPRSLGEFRLLRPEGEILAGRRKELVLLVDRAWESPGAVTCAALAALLRGDVTTRARGIRVRRCSR